MAEQSGVTLAPVHGACVMVSPAQSPNATTLHQVALQPETGEPEVVCVVSTTEGVSGLLSSSSSSQMDQNANTQMLGQCDSCTHALLPKTTEEACTQTLPDQCPPYVDIRSPAVEGACRGSSISRVDQVSDSPCPTPQLTRSPARGSPSITPGQCTPLLEQKSEHFSLGIPPPVVICGGLGNAGLSNAEKSETSSAVLPICRICHMTGELDDEQEMLISPCRCAGTLQFIHNTCLQVGDTTANYMHVCTPPDGNSCIVKRKIVMPSPHPY